MKEMHFNTRNRIQILLFLTLLASTWTFFLSPRIIRRSISNNINAYNILERTRGDDKTNFRNRALSDFEDHKKYKDYFREPK